MLEQTQKYRQYRNKPYIEHKYFKMIHNAISSADFNAARYLYQEYYNELLHIDTDKIEFKNELKQISKAYADPNNALILKSVNNKSIGCVGIIRVDTQICEMKRLFVLPEFRGQGYGLALAKAIIDMARYKNYRFIRLDTLKELVTANTLYAKLGFQPISPYLQTTEVELTYWRLELD